MEPGSCQRGGRRPLPLCSPSGVVGVVGVVDVDDVDDAVVGDSSVVVGC